MGITSIEREAGQLSLPSDLGRDILRGECAIRDPVNEFEANFPGAITDDVFGIYNEEFGDGEPGHEHPVRFLRQGEMNIRLQDNAAVPKYSRIMPSASDAGSGTLATTGAHVFARSLEVSPATTPQFVRCELFAAGVPFIEP